MVSESNSYGVILVVMVLENNGYGASSLSPPVTYTSPTQSNG
jgi:hypothetical protein